MKGIIISPQQCRMGRAFLDWSQPQLAERAGLSVTTVSKFESGDGHIGSDTLAKLAAVFELAGVVMLASGGMEPSSRLVTVLEGPEANYRVMEDALHTLKQGGGEVLICGLTEAGPEEVERRAFVEEHIARLNAAGVTERILLRHGDRNLVAPRSWYRWMPAGAEFGAAFQLYGDKIAMKDLGAERIVVIEHALFAATVRGMFDVVWASAAPVS